MNPDELRRLFPNASQSFFGANIKVSADNSGDTGTDPKLQEQQNDSAAKSEGARKSIGVGKPQGGTGGIQNSEDAPDVPDNKARVSKKDGSNGGVYRVTITVRFSNRLRTDLSGKLDTILDCITRARRRLLDDDPGGTNKRPVGRDRAGRRYNYDSTDQVKGDVPF